MITLNSIQLPAGNWEALGDRRAVRGWRTPDGDVVTLHHLPNPPDIGADIRDLDGLRQFYRRLAYGTGRGLVEVDLAAVHSCLAVRVILKQPRQPHGMTYLGSLTLPFRDFSFELDVQCAEHGLTGLRETAVLGRITECNRAELVARIDGLVKENKIDFVEVFPGWAHDPYDTNVKAPVLYNESESRAWDAEFPHHPLSRLRRVLLLLERSAVDSEVHQAPPFSFASTPPRGQPWWTAMWREWASRRRTRERRSGSDP